MCYVYDKNIYVQLMLESEVECLDTTCQDVPRMVILRHLTQFAVFQFDCGATAIPHEPHN